MGRLVHIKQWRLVEAHWSKTTILLEPNRLTDQYGRQEAARSVLEVPEPREMST